MSSAAVVKRMVTPTEINATFAVMQQLRPEIVAQDYVSTIQRLMTGGYHLAAVVVGVGADANVGVHVDVQAVAGYRFAEGLAWGRYLYVDDLVTAPSARSHGHGKRLLDWLKDEARAHRCGELHLDSGVQRHGAHRFYLRERMDISSYHFKITI